MAKAKGGEAKAAPRGKVSAEGSGTIHRTIRLIAAIAGAKSDVGVGELSEQLTLPVPTIHRLLHLLRAEGIVEWNPKTHRYTVGPDLHRISAQVGASNQMPDIARREITTLSEELGETVLFGIYLPGSVAMSFEVRAEGDHPLQYRIQMHVPLSVVWGASGKAILAYLPEDAVAEALKREASDAKNGAAPPTPDELREELERVRKLGYCASEGEKLSGARGVAAPVFGPAGILGSICITSPRERIPINRVPEFGELVRASADRLSRSLGAPEKR